MQAQVQRLKESRLTIRGDGDQEVLIIKVTLVLFEECHELSTHATYLLWFKIMAKVLVFLIQRHRNAKIFYPVKNQTKD